MPEEEELLDEELAVERLNAALSLQLRSALQYSLTAASLVGLAEQAVAGELRHYGDDELTDARRLVEKIVSLGGSPTTEVAELRFDRNSIAAIGWLIECENAIAALSVERSSAVRRALGEVEERLATVQISRDEAAAEIIGVVEDYGLRRVETLPAVEKISADDLGVVCWMVVLPAAS